MIMAREISKQNHDAVDLMKAILAIMVVSLHILSDITPYITILFRLAVPIFFITSSYFFFIKQNNLSNNISARENALKKFEWRLFRLYLCWAIIEFPLTMKLWMEKWIVLGYGTTQRIAYVFVNFLLGSTFYASWYLMALMLGTITIAVLSRWLHNRWLFILSLLSYLFCCRASYGGLFFYPPTSVMASFFWIVLGKMIADNIPFFTGIRAKSPKWKCGMITLALICYYYEAFLCLKAPKLGTMKFILPFLAVFIFLTVLDIRTIIPRAKIYRTVSTVTYCAHGAVFSVLIAAGNRIGIKLEYLPYNVLGCIGVIIICTLLGVCIHSLKQKKNFRWLAWFC